MGISFKVYIAIIIRTFFNIQYFRNVHSDIHGGLNNWIEARCPLSSYGCGFAVRRVFPGSDPRARLVYSQEITSFGVRPAPVTSLQPGADDAPDHGGLTLTSLPLELVQLVFTYLDSWSLANLGLVSVRCRELVSGLLDDKGCVALQWERRDQETLGTGTNTGWVVAYKRWFFSSHFSPVTRWGLGGEGAVTEHLKSCPYNIRTTHTKPDTQSKQWTSFMSALKTRLKDKRNSEWFIE